MSLSGGLLRPGGYLAMNYQDFDHPIRRLRPAMKTGWNVMFNLSDRSFSVLTNRAGFEVVHRAGNEWHLTTLRHICHHWYVPSPPVFSRIPLMVPAISFRWVLARTRA